MTTRAIQSVPATVEDVTPHWLTQVLAERYPGVVVVSSAISPMAGHKPTKVRLHLQYNAAGEEAGLPATMVIKSTFSAAGKMMDLSTAAEALSYRDFVPKVEVNTPKTFYIGITPQVDNAIMLLEDLDNRDGGVIFHNSNMPLDYGQAIKFVDSIAKFHAATWNSPAFSDGGEWGPSSNFGIVRKWLYADAFGQMIKASWWNENLKLPRSLAMPRKLRDQKRIEAAWHRLRLVMKGAPEVMVHGDEHLGNCFIGSDGSPGFIDWLARPEHWAMGYTQFITNALDGSDRRDWERPLLSRYLARLAAHGVDAPTFDEAWFLYRAALIYPWIVWYSAPVRWQPEWIDTEGAGRAGLAMLDHGTLELLGV